MTQSDLAWGAGPSARYDDLAARFRPLFATFAQGAARRDRDRQLPFAEIGRLKTAGFGALRVPIGQGGAGASLPELFALLIELAAADSNLPQALRAHFGFTEDVLMSPDAARRERWLRRIGEGDLVGGAWSEVGDAKLAAFSTRVSGSGGDLRLDGTKYYTTGSLFADWIDVGASDAADEGVGVAVARHAPGVEILDDWDGMGQALTASGTAVFSHVPVEAVEVTKADLRFGYAPAFFQLVQLATIAGIGRSLANDLASAVAKRARTYTHAAASRSSEDPQVLQVVGRVRGAAYTAGAVVLKGAEAVQRAADARADPEAFAAAVQMAELESAQAQGVVIDLVLQAATVAYDALGASAVKRDSGLDRHWRNARTLASHNPRIYKDRIVGTMPSTEQRLPRSGGSAGAEGLDAPPALASGTLPSGTTVVSYPPVASTGTIAIHPMPAVRDLPDAGLRPFHSGRQAQPGSQGPSDGSGSRTRRTRHQAEQRLRGPADKTVSRPPPRPDLSCTLAIRTYEDENG